MSIAEKLNTIAENEQKVYDTGYSQGESDVWDGISRNGNRTTWSYAFRYWDCEYIRPTKQIKPTGAIMFMFPSNPSLKIVEKAYFDFSNAGGAANDMCQACTSLVTFEDLGMPAMASYNYAFSACPSLKTIECLRFNEKTTGTTSMFSNCVALENITIEGEIYVSLNISYSPLLTQASINSIIDHLADLTGQTAQKLTFHSTIVTNLTEEQVTKIINKNWTIS